MIIKTLYTRQSAVGWLGYIKYHSLQSEWLEDEFRGLFNQSGSFATRREIEMFVDLSENTGLTRMIIFAPARYVHPIYLSEYTRETMWRFISEDKRQSLRYMYSLHYNTEHPHSHVVLTAYYPEDLLFKERENILIRDIATQVFREPIGVPEEVVKKAKDERKKKRIQVIIQKTAEIEKYLNKEYNDIKVWTRKGVVKSVDDVVKMRRGMEIG